MMAGLCVGLFVFSQTVQAQYVFTNLNLTGWNSQFICANSAGSPAAGTSGPFYFGFVFYESGAPVPNCPSAGFPASGYLPSTEGLDQTFQLQPYNGNDSLNVTTSGETLTLTPPQDIFALQVLTACDVGPSNLYWSVTLTYTNGATNTFVETSTTDWTVSSGTHAAAVGLTGYYGGWGDNYCSVYLHESDFSLPGANCGSPVPVSSLTFTLLSGDALAVFAVNAYTGSAGGPVPPPPTNTFIISDAFDGVNDTNGRLITGRHPSGVDLPGGVYVQNAWSTYPCGGYGCDFTDQIGNPLPAGWNPTGPGALYGFDNWSGISIESVGGVYGKPNRFRISAEVNMGSMSSGAGDTARGWFVGFSPAISPESPGPNGPMGFEGANNLEGLWLSYNTLSNNTWAVFLNDGPTDLSLGSSGDYNGTNNIIAYLNTSILGTNNFSGWYTVTFDVNTVSGSISNISVSDSSGTQQIPGVYGREFTDPHTMIALAGTSDDNTATNGVAAMDKFSVYALASVVVPPVIEPPAANILFDEFADGCDGQPLGGRTPDTINLPGGTWSAMEYDNYLPVVSFDASDGNPPGCVQGGSAGQMWVPIGSSGSYQEPTVLTVEADMYLGSLSAGDTARGIMLGFCSGTPTNISGADKCEGSYSGHEGADNFAGIWFDPAGGGLWLQQFNNSYLGKCNIDTQAGTGNTNTPCGNFSDVTNMCAIANYDNTVLTNFNNGAWYHLSYQVNTTSDIITNLMLADMFGHTQMVTGAWSLQSGFGPAPANKYGYLAIQMAAGSGGGDIGYVDNVGVSGALPGLFQITSITRTNVGGLASLNVVWTTTGGTTNVVQATNGSANGSYSTNNFAGISGNILIPGSGAVTNSYTDVGGGTNRPSRFYRIEELVP